MMGTDGGIPKSHVPRPLLLLFAPGSAAPLLLVLAAGPATLLAAQTPSSHPDFSFQGEYRGIQVTEAGDTMAMGAQVAALGGKGGFRATLLKGGLPGEGWDGQEKLEAAGKAGSAGALFTGEGYEFSLGPDNGPLQGTGPGGADLALEKVFRSSPTEGAPAPAGAIVLFNGSGAGEWDGASMDEGGWLAAGGATKKGFEDCFVHLEFRLPFTPDVPYGNRGNSGVYLQSRYEVQVYDSFAQQRPFDEADWKPWGIYADGGAGAIYKVSAPTPNMCYPPLSWQTLDIAFRAPRWNGDSKVDDASFTVWHNGVMVLENVAVAKPTVGALRDEDPGPAPLYLQEHKSPVVYRNIWLVEGDGITQPPVSIVVSRHPRGTGRAGIFPLTGIRHYATDHRVRDLLGRRLPGWPAGNAPERSLFPMLQGSLP